ncbi:MAG: hypothetical protein N3D84_02940 [Candidatus Woesearchaeota archaeon]|nr:hypothetical protein [Candidatus Woesearchaeota archaeon]
MAPENDLCKDCANWKNFREKCWFYWEEKKECSQFKEDILSEPRYKNIRFNPEDLLRK